MGKSVLWLEMTWPEIQEAIAQTKVLLFVVGAVEQHGLALPTSVDILLPMAIAKRVAELINGVVAPCTNYGYKSLVRAGGGPHFPGSVGMHGATVIAMVYDILTEFIRQGWRRIVVLDWHLENVPFVFEGVDEALRAAGEIPGLKVVKIDNPNSLGVAAHPGLQDKLFGPDFPGWAVEHAAIWETSAMLAAFPDLVQNELITDGSPPNQMDYDVLPVQIGAAPETGVFWKATRATREKGELILAAVTESIATVVKREFEI